ncbi:MAG: hypothetical protein OEN02_06515 [Gammaproteobacteria bacterium]|nr:hypothetical protein [Gammaproteobacteria bacterium]
MPTFKSCGDHARCTTAEPVQKSASAGIAFYPDHGEDSASPVHGAVHGNGQAATTDSSL